VIQAAIADLHLHEARDWEEIALLCQQLEHIASSPIVTMNRAIAVAELEGPHAALAPLDRLGLDGPLLPLDARRPAGGASAATMRRAPPPSAPSS
jgi:predicted RNA polymerase sigma factor